MEINPTAASLTGVPGTMVYAASVPPPTRCGVPYGPHSRNVLDCWQADSDQPTPFVFVVHGGAWIEGEKERISRFVEVDALLKAGISVVAINYRFVHQAGNTSPEPPVSVPLLDTARAVQFVRSKAGDWNLDRSRMGAAGGSAGACACLWLAFTDDLAQPGSSDPVARESTKPSCVAVKWAQTTLDPLQMREWTPNSHYGGHAFGYASFEQFLANRERILASIEKYSPLALIKAGAPPIYLYYDAPPALGQDELDPTHTANFGLKLRERCAALHVACDLVYPGAPRVRHGSPTEYLIAKLKTA